MADPAGVALAVAGGLLAVSLAAPWAAATEGLGWGGGTRGGWAWLAAGVDVAVASAAAVMLALGVARLSGRATPRPLPALAGGLVVGVAALVVVTSLHARDIAAEEFGRMTKLEFALEWARAPVLALGGFAVGLGGAALAAHQPRPTGTSSRRALSLLGIAIVLGGATFAEWSWLGGAELVDAWGLYEWAATALVLIAAAVGLAAAMPRHPALLALPIAAALVPFLDYGVNPPAGISEPLAQEGSAVNIGVAIALAAVLAAALLLAPSFGRSLRSTRATKSRLPARRDSVGATRRDM